MTGPPSSAAETDSRKGQHAQAGHDWRSHLGEAWPLLVVGGGCVGVAIVMALGRIARLVDHLSPTFLFLAVGLTGIAGGVASYLVGGDVNSTTVDRRAVPGPLARDPTRGPVAAPASRVAPITPHPNPGSPAPSSPPSRASVGPAPTWGSAPGGSNEIPRSLFLDPRLLQRPAPTKGRLLRLSEEGALTVYSLGEALRDLDSISRSTRERRARSADSGPATKDGSETSAE